MNVVEKIEQEIEGLSGEDFDSLAVWWIVAATETGTGKSTRTRRLAGLIFFLKRPS